MKWDFHQMKMFSDVTCKIENTCKDKKFPSLLSVVTTSTFLSNMHKSQKTSWMFYVFVLTFCLLRSIWSHFQSKIVEIHWTWENWTEDNNNNFSYCMQGKENPAKGTSSQRVDWYKPLIYSNLRPVIRDNWKSVVFFQ